MKFPDVSNLPEISSPGTRKLQEDAQGAKKDAEHIIHLTQDANKRMHELGIQLRALKHRLPGFEVFLAFASAEDIRAFQQQYQKLEADIMAVHNDIADLYTLHDLIVKKRKPMAQA